MLQAEEERALKHIEETRTRVKDMLKQKNEQMNKDKQKRRVDSMNSKQSRTKIGFGKQESRSQLRTDISK